MPFNEFKRMVSKDPKINRDLQQLQNRIESSLRPILSRKELDTSLIEDISLTTGSENLVEHKQGKEIQGWYVVSIDAAAHVYENTSTTADKKKYLSLNVSANATVSLLLFTG